MLVKYWNKVAEYLQEQPYFKARVISVPTTILRKGEKYTFQANGEMFRALGPLGQIDLGSLNSAVEQWGEVAIQQLVPAPTGIFVAVRGMIKCYADYFKVVPQPVEREESQVLADIVRYLSDAVGDPVYAYFAKYRGVYFLYEVGPFFLQENDPLKSFAEYGSLYKRGAVTLTDLRLKFQRYWEWINWEGAPSILARAFYEDLVFRTGNDTFVGQIDGTCKEGVPECNMLEPCARLYRLGGFKDFPDPEIRPRTNKLAFVFTASLVHSDAVETTVLSLKDLIDKWGCPFQEVTLYLEGVSDVGMFLSLAKSLQSPWPLGLVLSTYVQVLNYLDSGLGKYVASVLVDADALVDEGSFGRVLPPDTVVALPSCIGDALKTISNCGVMYTRQFATSTLWALAQSGDFAYVNGCNWARSVVMRAIACP